MLDSLQNTNDYHPSGATNTLAGETESNNNNNVEFCHPTIGNVHDDWYFEVIDNLQDRRRRWAMEMQQIREQFFFEDSSNSFKNSQHCFDAHSAASKIANLPSFNQKIHSNSSLNVQHDSEYFTTRIDVSDFDSNNISVSIPCEGQLMIRAWKLVADPLTDTSLCGESGETLREFSRIIELPAGAQVESDDVACTLSEDDGHLTISVRLGLAVDESGNTTKVGSEDNVLAPEIVIPVEIGKDFAPSEILVRTNANKAYVEAQLERVSESGKATKELRKQIEIPSGYSSQSVTAKLRSGVVYLKALRAKEKHRRSVTKQEQ